MGFSTGLALGVAAALVVLAVVVALLVRMRQERARTAALMARLEELEARLEESSAEQVTAPIPDPPAPTPIGHPEPTPSGDVLAGLTSRLVRLVAGSGEEAATLAEQAIVCVHRNVDRGLTPHGLAEELHVSLRTLERGLLLSLDCSPRQLILAMKMREARRLLLGGRLMVKEVAFRLGFGDQYHFSRCFKSFYHVAPSEVRPSPSPLR